MILGSQCYHHFEVTEPLNMTMAQLRCAQDNLTLATVHSWQENHFIRSLVQDETVLHGGYINLAWVWLDGTAWDFSFWGEGQPQPSQGNCILMDRDGFWRSSSCAESVKEFTCQLEKGISN